MNTPSFIAGLVVGFIISSAGCLVFLYGLTCDYMPPTHDPKVRPPVARGKG